MSPDKTVVTVGKRTVPLSNLDKVLWPDSGYTKAHLIEYCAEMAPVLLPHLKDRPLTVIRYPDGVSGHHFYQKNVPPHAPAWVRTYATRVRDRAIRYVLADETATLVWLANQGAVEFHPWLSTVHRPAHPDQIVIDLDPNPPAGFEEARRVASVVREVLANMGLRGYPKLSGATGVHVYVPVAPVYPFAVTSRLAGFVGNIVSDLLPHLATIERRVHRRGPRVYVDHLQNLLGQTVAAPYSVRARPGATVSAPVTWDELSFCNPADFTIKTMPDRVRRCGDLFAPVLYDGQSIDAWVDELGPAPGRPAEKFSESYADTSPTNDCGI